MWKAIVATLLLCCSFPLYAQRRVDLIIDAEGVRRTGRNTSFSPNAVRYDPSLGTGGGFGVGIDWYASDRVSLEVKAAALEGNLRVAIIGVDYVLLSRVGRVQVYPITALLKWHVLEHGSLRPYLGVGAAHIFLHDIEKQTSSFTGVKFDDPTGLVLDGGVLLQFSRRWALSGDVRYIPIETSSRATFRGVSSSVELNIRPVIAGFGIDYRF
jgi:outer membrane protein W